jgi:regulator of cell morphogenesis and NO signaling
VEHNILSYLKQEDTVSQTVVRYPKLAEYFRSKGIDYCCGGKISLHQVSIDKGLDINQLIDDLTQYIGDDYSSLEEDSWATASSGDLIAHIVNKHHLFLRNNLPQLHQHVVKVARVHGDSEPHLLQVEKLFEQLKLELLEHTNKEEEQVFPKMIHWEEDGELEVLTQLRSSISELESEHDNAGDILRAIRQATNEYQLPEHACTTYQMTYRQLEELEGMTFTHVHLENNILFPRYS